MRYLLLTAIGLSLVATLPAAPQPAPEGATAAALPVRELTAFKDGHAVVIHEGRLTANAAGEVVLDTLPSPILGAFWPYATDPESRLIAVTAGRREAQVQRSPLSIIEFLEANVGADATITELDGRSYDARIHALPSAVRDPAEQPGPGEVTPRNGDIVLLSVGGKLKALPLARIRDVSLRTGTGQKLSRAHVRPRLTVKLSRGAGPAGLGLMYVQRGFRWIPGYRVTLDGKGKARMELQATLVNDLTDVRVATVNLVVGAPEFAFAGTPDPIGMQQELTQVAEARRNQRMNFALSNGVMSQAAGMAGGGFGGFNDQPAGVEPGPEVGGSQKAEDLFVFTVRNVSLRKGERMVVPVAQFELPYEDIFALDIPFSPPPDVRGNLNQEQQQEIQRLLAAPKVHHRIRLTNSATQPLTTAPALVLLNKQVLAQGMMTYTAPGGKGDLKLNPAVDIKVRKQESETGRVPRASEYEGQSLQKVSLKGTLSLRNLRGTEVSLEVTRHVLGHVNSADQGGEIAQVNLLEDEGASQDPRPYWWTWYHWPSWWHARNGIGRITWRSKLAPGATLDLGYTWHYFTP